jgi:hypothetical protein
VAHVGDDLAELLAPVNRVGRRCAAVALEGVHLVLTQRVWAAKLIETAIARDPVEPGPGVDRAVVGADGVERGGEHVLEHILRVLLGAEHVTAEREQSRLVALNEGLEGCVVTAPDQRDEPLVALEAEQRRTSGDGR